MQSLERGETWNPVILDGEVRTQKCGKPAGPGFPIPGCHVIGSGSAEDIDITRIGHFALIDRCAAAVGIMGYAESEIAGMRSSDQDGLGIESFGQYPRQRSKELMVSHIVI